MFEAFKIIECLYSPAFGFIVSRADKYIFINTNNVIYRPI
jgi:hypothetical protein